MAAWTAGWLSVTYESFYCVCSGCVCVRWNDIHFTVESCVSSQIYVQFSMLEPQEEAGNRITSAI